MNFDRSSDTRETVWRLRWAHCASETSQQQQGGRLPNSFQTARAAGRHIIICAMAESRELPQSRCTLCVSIAPNPREPPPAQSRIAAPSQAGGEGRAQPQRAESLRRPPIIDAPSRCVSARPGHPRSRGPARPTYRGGLPTRSCGSEASSFSPTAPRMTRFCQVVPCFEVLSSKSTCSSDENHVLRIRIKQAI